MKIDKVNIHKILLPFLGSFSHSRKKGASVKNVVVEVIADDGEIRGYGEGAPRVYVTGESQQAAADSISNFLQTEPFPWQLRDVSQIWDFVDSLQAGKGHNAAICALEMALLDALGKRQNMSISEYFPKEFSTDRIFYGAAIPLADKRRVMEVCKLIIQLKINKLRIKMGKDLAQNRDVVETVKRMFRDDCDLRIDVNGAWDRQLALKHIKLIREYHVKVVEQPMMPDDPDMADFARAMQALGIILMADESACSLGDVERIMEEGYFGMINVRLSKCGGFRNSLKIIDLLRKQGLSFQIGCQLGESGLLSAAGRTLGLLCADAVYHDGSYDELLLKENVTRDNVSFGPGGEAGALEGPGLGVKVNIESLERLCDGSPSVTILRP
jgi:muconate cycloisomerase